jgi:hypothetical protein
MEFAMKLSQRFALTSFFLFFVAFANAALAADNCQSVKEGVKQQWGAVAWGPLFGCYSLTPMAADQDGGTACLMLLGQGVLGHAESREVNLWIGGPVTGTLPWGKTYLGFCAGNKRGIIIDPKKADEERKALDARIKR